MISFLAAVVAAGTVFTCTPVAVYDGDGPIWCAEGPKIRLAGIAAREMDETCRANQPCPAASAVAARDYLVRLIGTPIGRRPEGHILVKAAPMVCRSEGSGRGARTAAWCGTRRRVDLSCAMVRAGMALRWAKYRGAEVCSRRPES